MITFVVPPLHGPTTGGTLYNRCLLRALGEQGEPPEVLSLAQARVALGMPEPRRRTVWVDSLWLDALPELVARASPPCRVGLLTHYLPVLVAHGERPSPALVSKAERAALEHAQAFVATSEYLAHELHALGVERERVWVVSPGTELPVTPYPPSSEDHEPLRAVVLANVVEGKEILPLLQALARHLRPDDALELGVVGSPQLDPAYAEACTAVVATEPALRARVRWHGGLDYPACIEALLHADLLLSASRMESYGMALADARACGRPILARPGGNVAAHVDPRAGGQLVPDVDALARACLSLTRDRPQLRERQQRAWARRAGQPWSVSADQLRSASSHGPPPRPPQ